jgi:hypothetical protein
MMITFVFVMITFVFVMHTSSDKLIFLISGLGAIYCYNEFSKRWLEICKTIDKLREVEKNV